MSDLSSKFNGPVRGHFSLLS
ncbi:hypothetical protein BC2230_70014 [Burkholderia cepacia]